MPPARQPEKRWAWYGQVLDAALALFGMGILGVMAYRNSWPPLGVLAAMVCIGSLSASGMLRYLLGRWENGEKK